MAVYVLCVLMMTVMLPTPLYVVSGADPDVTTSSRSLVWRALTVLCRVQQGDRGQQNKGTHGNSTKQHTTSKDSDSLLTAYRERDRNICECFKRIFWNVNLFCDCWKSIQLKNSQRSSHRFFGAKLYGMESIASVGRDCDKFVQSGNTNSEHFSIDQRAKRISSSDESRMEKNTGINHIAVTKHGTLHMNKELQTLSFQAIVNAKATIKAASLLLSARRKRNSDYPHQKITTTTLTSITEAHGSNNSHKELRDSLSSYKELEDSINSQEKQGGSTSKNDKRGDSIRGQEKIEDRISSQEKIEDHISSQEKMGETSNSNEGDDDSVSNPKRLRESTVPRNDTEEREAELAYRSHTFMGLVDTRGQQSSHLTERQQADGDRVAKEVTDQASTEAEVVTEVSEVSTSSEQEVMLPEAFATLLSPKNNTDNSTTDSNNVSRSVVTEMVGEPLPAWDEALATWGDAWPLHVYTVGVLSALLAVYSLLAIIFQRSYNLLSCHYFVLINSLLSFLGGTRATYFLTDPYNANHTFHPAAGYLLHDLAFPCVTSCFSLLFLVLVDSSRMRPSVVQPTRLLAAVISLHFLFSICADITAGCLLTAYVLRILSQAIFVVWGLVLFCGYIALFHTLQLSNQSIRIGSPVKHRHRHTLSRAVKLCFLIALCGILAAALQLYAMLSVFSSTAPKPWPWWGYTLSMRLVELTMCFTMSFVATEPLSQTCSSDDDKPPDYHNGYYNGNSPDSAEGFFPTTGGGETFPMDEPQEGGHDTLRSTASQRSRPLSMLVDDNGLIRFREETDPASAAVMYSTDDELGSCGDIQPQDVFYECHPHNKTHSVPNTGANTPLTPRSYYSADSEGAYSEAFSFRPPSSIHLRDSIDRALNYPHFTLRTPDFVETPDYMSRSDTPDSHNVPMSPPSGHHHRAHYDSRVYPSSQAHIHRKSSLRCILNQLSRSRASSRHNSRSDDGSMVSLRAPRHRRLSLKEDCKTVIRGSKQAVDEL